MMKTPTLLTCALAVLLAAPSALRAEDPKPAAPAAPAGAEQGDRPRGGQRVTPAERLNNMKEKLGLTEEQVGKVQAIFEKTRGEMAKLREDQSMKPEDRRAKAQELRKAEMEEVRGLLTPEQKEKMKDLRPAGDRVPRGDRKPDAQ